MKNTQSVLKRIISFVGSKPFFWCVVALLVLEAAWIALSGRYPMAFDEDFHLGVIKLYANHPNPFWNGEVLGGDAFGAVARDPSYLYHYLMSFPYKLASWVTSDLKAQVLFLRALNIGFFAAGLIVYRRLLLKTRASSAVVHLCLLVLVLIPVTPLLAAQINYDNVFIPLCGLTLLAVLRFIKGSTTKSIDINAFLLLIALCITTSLVKYAFLPIFIVIVVYLSIWLTKKYTSLRQLGRAISASIKNIGRPALIGLIGVNLLLGGLFIERYGVNLLRYHAPVADCAEVLDYDHCQYYGPWIRDYNLKLNKTNQNHSPIAFGYEWARGMWLRSFFAVDGPSTGFQTRGPLTAPALGAIAFAVLGLLAFVMTANKLWHRYDKPTMWLMATVSLGYISVLWLEEYRMYIETGRAVAINGRYLLPVLPFLILFAALAIRELTLRRPRLQLAIAVSVVFCLAWGGGATTYILRSNDAWYWDSQQVKTVNHAFQRTVGPITPGYNHPTQYLR